MTRPAPADQTGAHVQASIRAGIAVTETVLVEAIRLHDYTDLDRLVLVDDPARPGYRWPASTLDDEVCDLDGYGTEEMARAAHPAATPYRCGTCAQWHNHRPRP